MFCCTLYYVHSSIAIIFMGKRELVALLNLSSWCLVMVEQLNFKIMQTVQVMRCLVAKNVNATQHYINTTSQIAFI